LTKKKYIFNYIKYVHWLIFLKSNLFFIQFLGKHE